MYWRIQDKNPKCLINFPLFFRRKDQQFWNTSFPPHWIFRCISRISPNHLWTLCNERNRGRHNPTRMWGCCMLNCLLNFPSFCSSLQIQSEAEIFGKLNDKNELSQLYVLFSPSNKATTTVSNFMTLFRKFFPLRSIATKNSNSKKKFVVDASFHCNETVFVNGQFVTYSSNPVFVSPDIRDISENTGKRRQNCVFEEFLISGWPHMFLVTTTKIKKHDQLLTDYGERYWYRHSALMTKHKFPRT